MSDPKAPISEPKIKVPVKGGSGEHPAVKQYQRQITELEKGMPALEEQAARLAEVAASSPPSRADPTPPPTPRLVGSAWQITIRGKGPHHNQQAIDANQMAADCKKLFRDAGHEDVSVTFENGEKEVIGP